jgi:phytanoyl-CoA hydroxylase
MKNHLKEYNDEGYTIIKGLFKSEEIEDTINELATIYSSSLSDHSQVKPSKNNLSYEDLCRIYDECASSNEKLKARAYDFSMLLASVKKMASKCSDTVKKIFTDKTFIISDQQVRCDDIYGSRFVKLHQDIPGMKTDSCISCWVPLVDTNEHQGGLRIVPRSHLMGPVKHEYNTNKWGLKAHEICDHDLYESKVSPTLTVDAGDALLFHSCLVHGTAKNKSEQSRWTFIARYDDVRDLRYLVDESQEKCVSWAKENCVI